MTDPGPDTGGRGFPARSDMTIGLAGLGVSGVAGLVVLATIAAAYGPAELGRFNLVLAGYLIISQIATLAIHHGVLHHLGAHREPEDVERRSVLLGAIAASSLTAVVIVAALSLMTAPTLMLVGREDLVLGMRWGVLAAGFFAFNKVLLGAMNALGRFRALALCNALRGGAMVAATVLFVLWRAPGSSLPAILLIAESALSIVLVLLLRSELTMGSATAGSTGRWARRLIGFGARGVVGGLLSDLNTRVDVLCLSLFVDDRAIGVYSLAAVVAEALHQVPIVVRSLLTPRLVTLLAVRDQRSISMLVRSVRARLLPGMLAIGAVTVALFTPLTSWLTEETFAAGRAPLIVLTLGVVLASAYTPFSLLLVQGGDPIGNSLLLASAVVLNVAGNLLLIPLYGIVGAAMATAASMVATMLVLRRLSRARLGVTI
jgi:stage V sporulation protein B